MRIAIIGGGISGLTAAHLLCDDHEVTLYEANDYLGGHTNTVDVTLDGLTWPVDTGFIVFNERTYPNFIRLLDRLGVASQPSVMSFSVSSEKDGLEYCATNLA
jgi:predicted NAD/FAD-binding protein